jgi:DNA-binding PadR family transcriptional regulator
MSMAERFPGNLLGLAVLSCLTERPMHPYEISQTLRERGKDESIKLNYGALYGVVDKLAAAGLIEARETVQQGRRPQRTVYALTEAGQGRHDAWLAELIRTPQRQYGALEAGLALVGGLPPDTVTSLLEERAMKLRLEAAAVEESRRIAAEMGIPEIFTVETDLRLVLLKAELDFVTRLRGRIRSRTLGGSEGWRRLHELLDRGTSMEEILRDPVTHLGEAGRAFLPEGRDAAPNTDQ